MNTSHRLLLDDGSAAPGWAHGSDVDVLAVPLGESSLRTGRDGRPRLAPGGEATPAAALRFEALDDRRVLLVVPLGSSVRLNGGPAPRVALLAPADRIDLPGGPTLHLARERRGDPVVVPAALVGVACGLCRVEFSDGTRVWICGTCGAALHLEGDDVPEDRRLTCARLASACTECQASIDLGTGLDHVPSR